MSPRQDWPQILEGKNTRRFAATPEKSRRLRDFVFSSLWRASIARPISKLNAMEQSEQNHECRIPSGVEDQ